MRNLLLLTCGLLLASVGHTGVFQLDYAAAVQPLPRGAAASVSVDEGTVRQLGVPAARAPKVDGTLVVGDRLALRLFDDLMVELELTERLKDVFAAESFVARAVVCGQTNRAAVVRTAEGLQISVCVPSEGRVYTVMTSSRGVTVREIDPRVCIGRPLPPRTPRRREGSAKRLKAASAAVGSAGTTVDLLVAYDQGAQEWVAGEGGITNFALSAVAKMNVALANTGLDARFRFRLVGVTSVAARSTDIDKTLDNVTDGTAVWKSVAAARKETGADVVSVLIDTGSASGLTGLGWALTSDSGDYRDFASDAYNVCSVRAVAQNHTMTHEVGHNMGAGHSDRQAGSPGPQLFSYSSGYYFRANGGNYHTIMAYDSDGVSSTYYMEVPYFSSPNYSFEGEPVGDADHDNTRTLANTFAAVSAFMTHKDDDPGEGDPDGSFYFDYDVSDGEATIFAVYPAVARPSTKLVIPSHLDGYPVTYLGDSILEECPGITSVVIPDTVVEIDGSFACYHSLEEIDLGKGLRWIYGSAFWSCNLKKLHLPASVEYIGRGGSGGCSFTGAFGSGMTVPAITVDPANQYYAARDGALYDKDFTELLCWPVSAATVELPETVETVDDQAFYLNPNVQRVKIPASVSAVDADAFFRCPMLTAVDVDPANPHYASVDGVLYDKNISELICVPYGKMVFTLPASVTSLRLGRYEDRNVFSYYSQGLTDILVEEGNPSFSSYDGALYDESGRTLLYVPQAKTALTLSPTVTDLGDRENIFGDLSLERLDVAPGNSSFATDDSGILYDATFENLLMAPKNLRSAVVPASVTSVCVNAFYGCRDLRTVTLGGAVGSIEAYAFGGCVCLTSVRGMESVRKIGELAFWCCYDLKELAPLDDVETVGESAFYLCTDLPSVTIGGKLASLGKQAFYGCESLRRVNFGGDAPTVEFSTYWSSDCGPFVDTPVGLRICVADGSRGWDGDPLSDELPEAWPVGDPNARAITHVIYALSYDLGGGVNAEENPDEYASADLPLVLKTPTRDGRSFEGWLLDGQAVSEIPKGTVGDLVLTAQWGDFGPGVWTTDVAAAKKAAATDGSLVCVVFANYAGCYYSWLFWPNLTDSAFLAWARENGIYLVNADASYDLGDMGSTRSAESWFLTLYRNWPETDGSIYYPTLATVYPESPNAPVGFDVFRPYESVGGGYYDGSVESLIDCLSFYVENKPAAEVNVPEVGERYLLGHELSIPVQISGVTQPKVTVSGLPRGVSYANDRLAGKPSVAGVFAVTVKADFGGGVVRKTSFSLVVYDPDGCLIKVDYDATRGTVSGAGAYKRGKSATLKATAKKGYVFSGWYDGETLVSRLASYVLTMLSNDVTLYANFIAQTDDVAAVSFALPDEMTNGVTEVDVSVDVSDCTSLPTVKVTGLPAGLKFTAKALDVKATKGKPAAHYEANTIYGTPTKSGVFTVVVTVTTAGKKTASASQTVVVRKPGEHVVKAEVPPIDDIIPGKVTGMGVYAKDKKVTLKAIANKGYVFAGWYDGANLVSRLASYVLAMPTNDVEFVAAFVTSEEDAASIGAVVDGLALEPWVSKTETHALATNVMAGVYLEWPVAASALSETTVKVAGLPSGLKFTAKPVTTKVTSGTGALKVTTVVTNVPANTIYGAPSAASKAGKPSTVKVTVTTAGKSKADYVISLTVDPIPDFAVGTFDGWYDDGEGLSGSATLTVAANGKVTGKVLMPVDGKGKSYSFSAASLSGFSLADDGSVTNVTVAATLTGVNKAAVPLSLVFAPDEIGIGCAEGIFDEPWSGGLWLAQNGWKRGGYVFPNIPKNVVKTLDDGLTLTFKKGGVVTIGGKIIGGDGVGQVSLKGSAQLVTDVTSAGGFSLLVYVAPAKNLTAGLCRLYDVELIDAAGDNVVTDVKLTER